jgi:acetyl-CoA acetyltransferase
VDVEPVLVLSAVRTAIGDFGGSLSDFAPAELGSLVIAEAVRPAALSPDEVQHVVMGNVIPTMPKDAYLALRAHHDVHRGGQGIAMVVERMNTGAAR